MLTLSRRPRDEWKTVTLAEGVTIGIRITRPTYEQMLAAHTSPLGQDRIAIRLDQITDWSDVVDDSGKPVPFSQDALADLYRQFPGATEELLLAVRPFFHVEETDRKNSDAPPSAAILPTPSSIGSTNSADSPPSPMPPA